MESIKRNYQREMEQIAAKGGEPRPRVLLHSCCGPCSSSVLETLTRYFDVTLLWYNPNIYPEAEFDKRLETQRQLIHAAGLEDRVQVLARPWGSEAYYRQIRGLENEPEHGRRCTACFRLRLEEAARTAKEQGYDYFCTTLTLSRHKNAQLINTLGEEIGRAAGVPWLPSDFKKRGGELRSTQLSREYGLYRQDYCGCEFSLKARENIQKTTEKSQEGQTNEA